VEVDGYYAALVGRGCCLGRRGGGGGRGYSSVGGVGFLLGAVVWEVVLFGGVSLGVVGLFFFVGGGCGGV